jgi:hypothetical protein
MQYDMHYYGTYAIAAAAGIPKADAETIATAAQFVDDQGVTEWMLCQSKEGVLGVATAHHPIEAGVRTLFGTSESNDTRAVWVPFHFLPGAEGVGFEERLICRKDSQVARRMLDYYLSDSVIRSHKGHALELMGIVAHVYADTFSHYGFSGIASDHNLVQADSIQVDRDHSQTIREHLESQADSFLSRFASAPKLGHGAATGRTCVGHSPMATAPSRNATTPPRSWKLAQPCTDGSGSSPRCITKARQNHWWSGPPWRKK